MKRLLPCLAILFLLLPSPPARTAHGEEEPRYAVAATADVWFYAAENEESGLFLLPYTYYVRVIREGVLYSAVQYLDDVAPYKSVRGFCKTEDLTFVDFIPERPYLRREIKLTYTLGSGNGMGGGAFDTVERTFVYYGTSYAGTARYYYVFADGVFDYVPATQEIFFDLNTDYLQSSAEELPPEETPEETPAPDALKIAIICAAAAAAVLVAVFVLHGKKPAPLPQEVSEF